jgi:ketosteroid isomerase-like protein
MSNERRAPMANTVTVTNGNRALIQNLYDSVIERNDMDEFLSYLNDDLVVHEPPCLPYGGTYRGKDALLSVIPQIAQIIDLSTIEVDYLVADGDRVIAVIRAAGVERGTHVHLAEESRILDGEVVEMRVYCFDHPSLPRAGLNGAGTSNVG